MADDDPDRRRIIERADRMLDQSHRLRKLADELVSESHDIRKSAKRMTKNRRARKKR